MRSHMFYAPYYSQDQPQVGIFQVDFRTWFLYDEVDSGIVLDMKETITDEQKISKHKNITQQPFTQIWTGSVLTRRSGKATR